MDLGLKGKVAIVTGGTQGIGRATALLLAREGAAVAIAARGRERLEQTAAAIRAAGGRVAAIQADVSKAADCERVVAEAVKAFGRLDILVNNAGTSATGEFAAASDEIWQADFDLKLFAAIRLTNALLPALRASKAAAVVNISSAAAAMPFAPSAHYGAAKAALEYYSRTLAVELAPSGIRVNVVSPGIISTPGSEEFSKTTPGFSSDDWLRNIPLGRIGATEDIAEVVALLVSDRGKIMTGANYRVDGGMTAR